MEGDLKKMKTEDSWNVFDEKKKMIERHERGVKSISDVEDSSSGPVGETQVPD